MSDEKEKGWTVQRLENLERRISELEGWTENFKEDMAIKLTELEEHIDSHGVVDQKLGIDMMKNREEIAELRDKLPEYPYIHRELHEKVKKELTELKDLFTSTQAFNLNCFKGLKERVEGIYKSVHGIAPDQADVNTEVLQELGKVIISAFVILQVPDNRIKTIEGLLEKLDSGGEKPLPNGSDRDIIPEQEVDHLKDSKPPETEKKEVDCGFIKEGYFVNVFGEIIPIPKIDSGGEKSHIGNLSDVEKSKITDDSKPPEPTCDDGSPIYPDIRDMYYSKKLGLEPREDDILRQTCKKCGIINEFVLAEEWKIVKREDLEFLFYGVEESISPYFHDNHGERFYKLKEEYNIE